MPNNLEASLNSFQATLSSQERSELSSMERAAMIAETRDLLTKVRTHNKGGAMGTTKRAQATPPPAGMPPSGAAPVTGQAENKVMPPVKPVEDGAIAPEETAPVMPPPVAQVDPAGGIEEFVDEMAQEDDSLSEAEMGIEEPASRVAAYVGAFGHLRIRPTEKRALEVFDPNTNQAIILIRPNQATRKNAQKLRRCAVNVLASIAYNGLAKTAQMWKGQIKRADGGVIDYGTFSQTTKPDFTDSSINDRGENTMQQDITLGVDSTTGEGDNLAAKQKPETRKPAGLSGKAAASVPSKGGILPGHDTNMADPPTKSPEGNALSSLSHSDSDKQVQPDTKNKGSDSSLDDEINTFANESLTAGLRIAQQPGEPTMPMPPMQQDAQLDAGPTAPPNMPSIEAQGMPGAPPPPPAMPQAAQPDPTMDPAMDPMMDPSMAPGMGADALPGEEEDVMQMTDEQRVARLYRKRAEKWTREANRNFIAKFVRCFRVAARRQALNLEPNHLKIAVADALMTKAALSQHEEYVPMDSRTAAFVVERGLDQPTAMRFVDSLIKRSAAFMKMSDEALTQVEDDLEAIQPVAPGMPDMMDDGMGMMDEDVEAQSVDPQSPSVMPSMPQMAGELTDWAQEEEMESEHNPGVAGMPEDMQMDDMLTETEEARAASLRNRAASGNLPINPGAARTAAPVQLNDKRAQIRFAVGGTKNAGLHGFFGGSR